MSHEEGNVNPSEANEREDNDITDENIITVLVASDINLGYEKTAKRDQEDDSFQTFEEILKYARDYEVDAILLGGNLFYEANPPLNVIMKCISLLRMYCLSDKPVKIDCITDPEWIFSHCEHKIVNFKDPNLNIGMPIFSIYGHRDAPIFSPIGPLDLLATTGLINYFGKWSNNQEMSIPPLLLRKGTSSLALYGLSHMNDGKLSKLLKNDKLELLEEESTSDVCNVLILHQNRARENRPENTFVSETLLPDFLNLVIWGHEPVCRIKHQPVTGKSYRISQPGSCIATSLSRGEAVPKQAAILQAYKDSFRMKYLKLKTVRPFAFDRLNVSEHEAEISRLRRPIVYGRIVKRSRRQALEEFVDRHIRDHMLPKAREQHTGHPKQPLRPLLRLKIVHYDDSDRFDTLRLTKKYKDVVANPSDMISFSNRSLQEKNFNSEDDDDDELFEIFFEDESSNWTRTVEGGISEYFNREENKKKLKVLSLDKLNKALDEFKRQDNKAFARAVRGEMQKMVNYLMDEDVELEDALEAVENYRN